MALKTYRQLEVWRKAIDLVEAVYLLAKTFAAEERFGLMSQVQRASVAIAAKIAEGYGRIHRGDYLHHLSMARGSLAEVETHLTIAVRLKFTSRERALEAWHLTQQVGKMLTKLIVSLQISNSRTSKTQTRNPKPETPNSNDD